MSYNRLVRGHTLVIMVTTGRDVLREESQRCGVQTRKEGTRVVVVERVRGRRV